MHNMILLGACLRDQTKEDPQPKRCLNLALCLTDIIQLLPYGVETVMTTIHILNVIYVCNINMWMFGYCTSTREIVAIGGVY